MTENIELHSFHTDTRKNVDIEEYDEINQDLVETTLSPNNSLNTFDDYSFFTQEDVKVTQKDSAKKKRSKKKERSSDLMEIITSELASIAVPIEENVISMVDYSSEQRNSYLETSYKSPTILQIARARHLDSEYGFEHRRETVKLTPVFSAVLESTVTEVHTIPVQYSKPAKFNEIIAQNPETEKQSTKFIDIEIKNIHFRHHHQFTLEKLLSVKLIECYNEYEEIIQTHRDIVREIKINRETRNNLKENFLNVNPDKKEDLRFDHTLRKYTEKLLEGKEKYLNILQKQKEVVHMITSLWSDLEMVREKLKCGEITYKLEVRKNILTQEEFEKEWNESFNVEFNDMLDKIEYEYVSNYMEYKEAKNIQNLDDSAKRRISKPKLHINEELLKEDVEKVVNNIVTPEKVIIHLKQDDSTPIELLSKSKKRLNKNEYNFEIYVDDVFVCESEHYNSSNESLIEFTESFSVQIIPKNTCISAVLFENTREVASFKFSLVEIKTTNSTAEYIVKKLVYNDIIAPTSQYVGSGHNIKEIAVENKVRLKSSNTFKGNLFTTCDVNIKMGWNEKLGQNDSEAVQSCMEIGSQLKRLLHGIDTPNIDTLTDIISKIYDKDVSNDEKLINTLRSITDRGVLTDDSFPIDENGPEYVRLKLLHLRNNGGFASVVSKLIPIHASQISTEHLSCLHKSQENDIEAQYSSDKYSEMDPIELQRFIGSKYVQKLNNNMLRNLNENLLKKTHKDVVRDFKDLTLRNLFSNQAFLPTLSNVSGHTKQQLLKESIAKEQEIRVTVLRAFNLPDRSAAAVDEDNDDLIAGYKVRPLRPFVKLTYRAISTQTGTAIGCHPTWNQTIKITTRLEPISAVHIDVYDEQRTNISTDSDSQRIRCGRWLGGLMVPLHSVLSLGHLRGTFKISTPPILFGYENPAKDNNGQTLVPEVTQLLKKDLSFISLQITTSVSHLGGLHEYSQPTNVDDDYLIKHLNTFVTDYVNEFPSRNISLTFIDSTGRIKCVTQFLQSIPLPDYESFAPKSLRSESALSKSSMFSKSSSSKREESEKASSAGEEKESLYSGHEGSWRTSDGLTKLMSGAMRYVSLIPTYEMSESHSVTLMGLELLKVLHGSAVDHTLLLASYFLQLGVRCYVAVGLGLPRGYSSYLITACDATTRRVIMLHERIRSRLFRGGFVWHVYDAVSGDRTELRDVACPMKTVHYVFDNDNIWVNVQSSQDCESVSFDFTRSTDWRPVFDKAVWVMKLPPAPETGLYSAPGDVERLRQGLETRLRDKLQRWRPHSRTIWNRYCSSLLRETLSQWERWAGARDAPRPSPSTRLRQLMLTYKMSGFALNIPYVSTKSVLATVKATAAHAQADPNAEFALAVEVYAYPNNVLSVWVFLASITRI